MMRNAGRSVALAAAMLIALSGGGHAQTFESDTDRPGGDFAQATATDASRCRTACLGAGACVAFTFVPSPAGGGACWLKSEIPEPRPGPGMISGLVTAADRANAPPSQAFAPEVRDPASQAERITGGPEADLVIRVGDVDNLGFGWPPGFGLFAGEETPVHGWPWRPGPDDAPGTDRIMVGTGMAAGGGGDGYHGTAEAGRTESLVIPLGELPPKVTGALLQLFVDDFQAPRWNGNYVVTLNGVAAPAASRLLNAIDQTGPIGKLVTLALPPGVELVSGGTLDVRIDDPTSGARDGFAIDFARLLVNPRPPLRPASIEGVVLDEATRRPIMGARVTSAQPAATTNAEGRFRLSPIHAGLALVEAAHPGYLPSAGTADVRAGETGQIELLLRRAAARDCAALAEEVARTGRATLTGILFDFDRATLRGDSRPALVAASELIRAGDTRWTVEGHTDTVGTAAYNQRLSQDRAQAVVDWLRAAGVPGDRLSARGFGFARPVADNDSEAGRALNRRVDLVPDRQPEPQGRATAPAACR